MAKRTKKYDDVPVEKTAEFCCPKCKRKSVTINNKKTPNKYFPNTYQYKCSFPKCKKTFYASENRYVFDNLIFDSVDEYCESRRKFAIQKIVDLIGLIDNNLFDLNDHPKDKKSHKYLLADVVNFLVAEIDNFEKIDKKFDIKFDDL